MKNLSKLGVVFSLIGVLILGYSCKNTEPSVIKIFVRSASNELVTGAKVVIIGDIQSDPPTNAYVDTVVTNNSGYALFNMDEYYNAAEEGQDVGYFDIVVKTSTKTAQGYVRSRVHTTAVETVFLPN